MARPSLLMAPLAACLLPWVTSGCPSSDPDTTAQSIRWVCAPERTKSDQRFEIRVAGGCTDAPDDYRCDVIKESDRVTVTLWGPPPCANCTCVLVNKPCMVPALPAGTWSMEFVGGEQLNRDVEVGPGHAMFQCVQPTDAGVVTDGAVAARG